MYVFRGAALIISCLFAFVGCSLDINLQKFSEEISQPSTSSEITFSPSILDSTTGGTLEVTGPKFTTNDQILINGTPCPNTVLVSDTKLTCTVPAQSNTDSLQIQVTQNGTVIDVSNKLVVSQSLGGAADNGTEMFKKNLGNNYGIKKISGKIYFNNSPNYKINILNSYPTQNYPDFDGYLGQEFPDKISMLGYDFNKYYSFSAYDFDSDGTYFVVADANQHRILIWNSIPTSATQASNVVLGHSNWLSKDVNDGGTNPSASSINAPRGIKLAGGKIFLADTVNNRVLIWNSIPTTNNKAADVVLGQPDFISNTANNGGISETSLNTPYHVEVVGTKLIVADTGNNRVLIWNTIPTASQTPADIVLGQADFSTNTVNYGGRSAKSLRGPGGVYSDGTRLFVADTTNHRILTWTAIPTVSYTAANYVLGQSSFTTATTGITDTLFASPMRVTIIDSNLVVSDTGNNRALFYTGVPTSSTAATFVVGQPSFTDNLSRNPNKPLGMVNVTGVTTDGTRLVAIDTGKHRVLIWNSLPTVSDQAPDVILGQTDINGYKKAASVSATSLNGPRGALILGNKLYVTDAANNRILVWNTWPTTNGQAADLVLGQSSFTASSTNGGNANPTGSTFSSPYAVTSDGTRFIVADFTNNRVMIWNSAPTANGQTADIILGQPDAVSGTINNGGVSAATLYHPYVARIYNNKLFVADKENQRMLIYNSIPTSTGAAADVVIGQADMTSNALNRGTGAISSLTLTAPMDMHVENNKLYILEDVANRISIFNTVPTTNGVAADSAMGISSLTTYAPAQTQGFGWPNSMVFTSQKIFVADYINSRILILPKPQ